MLLISSEALGCCCNRAVDGNVVLQDDLFEVGVPNWLAQETVHACVQKARNSSVTSGGDSLPAAFVPAMLH